MSGKQMTKRNIVGKNLRELRQARNLKQEDVANALDVPPPTYSSWERGRTQPDVDTILQLARYFDASVERLFRIESRPLKIGFTCPQLANAKFHPIKFPFGIYDSIYPFVFNRLYFFDIYERRLHVELMESWKAEPDRSRYVFRLRSNVKFHHGAPLELEDVKQSYELFLEVFPFFEKFIDSIKIAEEENGIELKLSEWMDLEHLPTPYIVPASYLEDDEVFEGGTGPYKLTAVEQQKRLQEGLKQPVTLESNNAYFGKLPIIQAVEIHRFGSGVESKDALENGEVDLAYDLDLVEPGKFEVERGHGTLAFYLVLNQSSEICEDENARKALDYSIDRERVINSVGMSGAELLPSDHLYLILSKAASVDGENNYDKNRADGFWEKALASLKEKGITDPVLKIGASIRDPETKEHNKVTSDIIAEIIKQLDGFGIKAEEELDIDKADAQVEVIGFKEPHAVYMILHSSQDSKRPFSYKDTYVDHLLDNVEGLDAYREIQKILTAQRFFLSLFRRGVAMAFTKELDTLPKRRVTFPYGPTIAGHWKFKA